MSMPGKGTSAQSGSSQRFRRRRGLAALELALAAPVLFLCLALAIDLGRILLTYTAITNCARNGALWLSDPLAPSQSPYANLFLAASADAVNLNPPLVSTNVTSSSGTDGMGNATVTVTVQYQFQMLTSYLGFGTFNISRQVTMRVAPQAPN